MGLDHIVICKVALVVVGKGKLGKVRQAGIPRNGLPHRSVGTPLLATVTQLLALIYKRFAGRTQQKGSRLLLLGLALPYPLGKTVLVVVGEEERGNGIGPLRSMV